MISVKWIFEAIRDKELNQLKSEIARRFGTELLDSVIDYFRKAKYFFEKF